MPTFQNQYPTFGGGAAQGGARGPYAPPRSGTPVPPVGNPEMPTHPFRPILRLGGGPVQTPGVPPSYGDPNRPGGRGPGGDGGNAGGGGVRTNPRYDPNNPRYDPNLDIPPPVGEKIEKIITPPPPATPPPAASNPMMDQWTAFMNFWETQKNMAKNPFYSLMGMGGGGGGGWGESPYQSYGRGGGGGGNTMMMLMPFLMELFKNQGTPAAATVTPPAPATPANKVPLPV